ALLAVFIQAFDMPTNIGDAFGTVYISNLSQYITVLASGIGILLVLLAWPSLPGAVGNPALDLDHAAGEFYALLLLSIAGIIFVAGANDIILLFLGIELASIPTYIMVSISRPLPVAQEAGVKYMFLGAMAAALMLFGFSYLYGVTGETHIDKIAASLHANAASGTLSDWALLGVVILLAGLTFKIAAVPLHEYVGDVYQGAATPVTALIAFVPKTSGFIAILKLMYMAGGADWHVPNGVVTLLWVLAVLTMCFGNALALLPHNVKRVFAYSSVAHSGYMLAVVTALVAARSPLTQSAALQGLLFYLAAYALMNTGALAVLMALPSRAHGHEPPPPGMSAETYHDIDGQGRTHIVLGLAMAVCCLSLTGIPLTIGFWGKVLLIKPIFAAAGDGGGQTRMIWLGVIMVVNALVSAGYYLNIIRRMFLGDESGAAEMPAPPPHVSTSLTLAIGLSVCGVLVVGIVPAAMNGLSDKADVQPAPAIAAAPSAPAASAAVASSGR
ncbi:MAG TPA: NADH-quinone oxidoreductase subunit N, partial [Tepidisphaeraceae bacterium]|nr:NADH-quinone oxidoreductase subunit N [Tepidisphaeraceae bacterium]